FHLIGKDISRFHCVLWPALLLAAGVPLPRMVYVHGFIYAKGEKLSKSLGNVVDPVALANEYVAHAHHGAQILRRRAAFGVGPRVTPGPRCARGARRAGRGRDRRRRRGGEG